ncbi:transglutaminase domain-containing protein [Nanoarchaeota archaeon]
MCTSVIAGPAIVDRDVGVYILDDEYSREHMDNMVTFVDYYNDDTNAEIMVEITDYSSERAAENAFENIAGKSVSPSIEIIYEPRTIDGEQIYVRKYREYGSRNYYEVGALWKHDKYIIEVYQTDLVDIDMDEKIHEEVDFGLVKAYLRLYPSDVSGTLKEYKSGGTGAGKNKITLSASLRGAGYSLGGNIYREIFEDRDGELRTIGKEQYPGGFLDEIDYVSDFKDTSVSIHPPREYRDYQETFGRIQFSDMEDKPINLVYDKKIKIGKMDMDYDYQLDLDSKELFCVHHGKDGLHSYGGVFAAGDVGSGWERQQGYEEDVITAVYLPGFTDDYVFEMYDIMSGSRKISGYSYHTKLSDGDVISTKGTDVFVNGKKLKKQEFWTAERFKDCYSFSKGFYNADGKYSDWEQEEEVEEEIEVPEEVEELPGDTISVSVYARDFYTAEPLKEVIIALDNQYIGMTNEEGLFKGKVDLSKLSSSERTILYAIKSGYNVHKRELDKKDIKVNINIKPNLEPFEVPEGFIDYVNIEEYYASVMKKSRNKLGYIVNHDFIDVHPHEHLLRSYSFPITSDDREDVMLTAMENIRDRLTYDKLCYPKKQKGCNAWHDSDYKAWKERTGVCVDFATLTIAFGNSYNIPTRPILMYWSRNPDWRADDANISGHAITEVNIDDEWITIDSTWDTFDDPCAYSRSSSCFIVAIADMASGRMEDVTDDYSCDNLCEGAERPDDEELESVDFYAGPSEREYKVTIDLSGEKPLFSYRIHLDEGSSSKFLQDYEQDDFDQQDNARFILNNIKKGFRKTISTRNLEFYLDKKDKKAVVIGIDFEFDVGDKLFYDINAFRKLYDFTLIVSDDVKAISPDFSSKSSDNGLFTYNYNLDQPGAYSFYVVFDFEKPAVVSGHPVKGYIADVAANRIDAKAYSVMNDADSVAKDILAAKPDMVFILDKHDFVPYSLEESLKDKGISVIRFSEEPSATSASVANSFWLESEEAAIANMYNFADVENAKTYAIKKNIPLLLTGPEGDSDIIEKTLEYLGVEEIYSVGIDKGAGAGTVFLVLLVIAVLGAGRYYAYNKFLEAKKPKKKSKRKK